MLARASPSIPSARTIWRGESPFDSPSGESGSAEAISSPSGTFAASTWIVGTYVPPSRSRL